MRGKKDGTEKLTGRFPRGKRSGEKEKVTQGKAAMSRVATGKVLSILAATGKAPMSRVPTEERPKNNLEKKRRANFTLYKNE